MDEDALHQYFSDLGKKGAEARKEALTPERRSEIGRNAVQARWAKHQGKAKKPADPEPDHIPDS